MEDLILIPGLGSDAAVWAPTIAALGDTARCTVGDTLSDDSLAAMAQRILAAAPQRFALAGVSMGGMVALEIMRTAPERVARLALVDSNASPDTPEQAGQRRATIAAIEQIDDSHAGAVRLSYAASLRYLVHPHADEAVREAIIDMGIRVGMDAYVRQTRAVMGRGDLRPVLATIAVPTIVVVGAQDVMTPLPMAEALRDGIAGARLHIVPDCGHLPPIEAPAVLAALFHEWLA